MKVFPGRSIGQRLHEAFLLYKDFCKATGKTSSITEFTLKMLKVESFPGIATSGLYTCKQNRRLGIATSSLVVHVEPGEIDISSIALHMYYSRSFNNM